MFLRQRQNSVTEILKCLQRIVSGGLAKKSLNIHKKKTEGVKII